MGWNANREQRSTRRVCVEMPVRFRVTEGNARADETHRTVTTNISVSGVAFVSDVPLSITDRLHVELLLPGNRGQLAGEAVLTRISHDVPGLGGWECAVQFDKATLNETDMLDHFVRSIDVVPLLEKMAREEASDLYLTAYSPPVFRLGPNKLGPADRRTLTAEQVESLAFGIMDIDHRETYRLEKEVNFAFQIPRVGRWCVNLCSQRGHVEATFHAVDLYVPTIAELGLPEIVRSLAISGGGGLICITGGAGAGKSTTIASMIRAINQEHERVVVTLEDPIQYIHENEHSLVIQREIGMDTDSFASGMRHVMRQNPDVVAIDYVPDTITMDRVMRIAQSGRLVFTAFPTSNLAETIKYIVSMYPVDRRLLVLHFLASCLKAVISQFLLPTTDGSGSALAMEVAVLNDAIRSAIRTNKIDGIQNIATSSSGSIPLDSTLRNLVARGRISQDTASMVAQDPDAVSRGALI